jgi:large subunit ribosomal protein L15
MPITQRVPKRGFKNPFRTEAEVVNVGQLAKLGDGATVDVEALTRAGLIRGTGAPVKLLGDGEAPRNLSVRLHRISASARSKIEAAGGQVELLG